MRRAFALLIAPAVLAAGAPAASAETRVAVDRNAGIRFTLEGKALTLSLIGRRERSTVPGNRVKVGCAGSFRRLGAGLVLASARWPTGAKSARFLFGRDISARAKWCALEDMDGSDHATVSFIRPERARFIAKGRGPGGEWWRLAGGRGDRLQPCLVVRFRLGGGEYCFDGFAEREAGLGFATSFQTCEGDLFVFGVTSLATARVRVGARGAPAVEVATLPRPARSRVRARFFMAVLPQGSVVRGVRALDEDGTTVGRTRERDGASEVDC